MTAPLYNIGPDAIADSGAVGGPGFALSRPEWIALQTACTNAAALPTTPEAFRNSLGEGAPADLSDFSPLLEAYQMIGGHTSRWTHTVYPAVVSLAGDVVQYGTSTVPSYYPQLLAEATVLGVDPDDGQARSALKAILDQLRQHTEERANRVGEVVEQFIGFIADAESDLAGMVGDDGDGGLLEYYADRYGPADAVVQQICRDLADEERLLRAANHAYDRDMVVATTSPTYAWIWPYGAVASAVVAGGCGERTVEALDRARVAEAEIAALPAEVGAAARLAITLHAAGVGTETITSTLAECLPVIQRMRGVWSGISADLEALASFVNDDSGHDDIRKVVMTLMELGIEQAVTAWAEVAAAASAFRANAYLMEDPTATMVAWKVRTQFASSTTRAA